MRYTHTREQVFSFLRDHPDHAFNPYEIAKELDMNHVTVYRILEFLQEHKLVHHVASLGKWMICHHQDATKDHNFLICKSCHSIQEYLAPHQCGHHHGFECHQHIFEVLGLCNNCRQKSIA